MKRCIYQTKTGPRGTCGKKAVVLIKYSGYEKPYCAVCAAWIENSLKNSGRDYTKEIIPEPPAKTPIEQAIDLIADFATNQIELTKASNTYRGASKTASKREEMLCRKLLTALVPEATDEDVQTLLHRIN